MLFVVASIFNGGSTVHFLVTIPAKGFLMNLTVEQLTEVKKSFESKSIPAYAKVGGGMVLIVDAPSPSHLMVELRKHQIMDAEVTPLVELGKVLDGYIEHKTTGKVGYALVS
jgi:hypothetical protein